MNSLFAWPSASRWPPDWPSRGARRRA